MQKSRRKRSALWFIPNETIIEVALRCNTMSDFARAFDVNPMGGNRRTLQERLRDCHLDELLVQWKVNARLQRGMGLYRALSSDQIEERFSMHGRTNRGFLKKQLFKEGRGKSCEMCNTGITWNGKPLVLHLDHINGVGTDHRRENLRLICPNCHSQTDSYAGRASRRKAPPEPKPSRLGMPRLDIRRAARPPREEVESIVKEHGYEEMGRRVGLTGAAIKKWLSKPYW